MLSLLWKWNTRKSNNTKSYAYHFHSTLSFFQLKISSLSKYDQKGVVFNKWIRKCSTLTLNCNTISPYPLMIQWMWARDFHRRIPLNHQSCASISTLILSHIYCVEDLMKFEHAPPEYHQIIKVERHFSHGVPKCDRKSGGQLPRGQNRDISGALIIALNFESRLSQVLNPSYRPILSRFDQRHTKIQNSMQKTPKPTSWKALGTVMKRAKPV